jgi:hypothetical protein
MKRRTPAYWPTRILLVVGFIATVVASALALTLMLAEPPMFGPEPTFLGLPNHVVVALVGLGPVLVGFAWMLRIFLGARDEPPA